MFSCEFCEIFKNILLQETFGWLLLHNQKLQTKKYCRYLKFIERKSGSNEKVIVKKYLENFRPYVLRDMKDNLKTSGEWKIHLTIKTNFASITDSDVNNGRSSDMNDYFYVAVGHLKFEI